MAILLSTDAIGDERVDASQLKSVIAHGPAVVGLAIAVVWAVAVRSGSRGGPLVLPAADVRHVLFAPVPRSQALRGPAIRQVRFSAFVGLVMGGGLAVVASRRLPREPARMGAGWRRGRGGGGRCRRRPGTAAPPGGGSGRGSGFCCSVVLIAWSGADLLFTRVTSPMTLLGQLALLPLRFHAASPAVLVALVIVALGGVLVVGGMSLEQAERRATLASQIRFALTLQDLRTVVLLRRQLTQEQSRPRPWVRLRSLAAGRTLVWRRDLRGRDPVAGGALRPPGHPRRRRRLRPGRDLARGPRR